MSEIVFTTVIGNILIKEERDSIIAIGFTDKPEHDNSSIFLKEAKNQLEEYIRGERQDFTLLINPIGTDFQKKVWDELRKINYGETISYQELANKLGDPKSIRAAATANGKNPIAIIIPCHRVIGSDGSMTGYAGGLDKKRSLLKIEGASVMNQMDIF